VTLYLANSRQRQPGTNKLHPALEDGRGRCGREGLRAITLGKIHGSGECVVVKDIEPNSVVVGIPGQPVKRKGEAPTHPDLRHDVLPDVVAARLDRILDRLDEVERAIQLTDPGNGNGTSQSAHGRKNGHKVRDEYPDFNMDYAI
jgi:hypothetical protein